MPAQTKLFLTGATGYIGGDFLHALHQSEHASNYEITALVRNSDKGAKIASVYPSVKLVYGDFSALDLLEKEAQNANVVLHLADADAEDAVSAIIKGLSAREQPGFLIHISGVAVLITDDFNRTKSFGEKLGEKIFNDLEGVSEITSLPEEAPHRRVDKLVLEAGQSGKVHTAIICPPTIYGEGRGPDATRSIQVPKLVRLTLEQGHGIRVNAGQSYWDHVHVHDLSSLIMKLTEEAAAGGSTAEWEGKPATWGPEGYYFVENGEHIWGEVSQLIAEEAHKQGFIKTDEVKSVTAEQIAELVPFGQVLWATNARGRAKRAREALKWKPTGEPLKDTIAAVVKDEAKSLGLVVGHAEVAAGEK